MSQVIISGVQIAKKTLASYSPPRFKHPQPYPTSPARVSHTAGFLLGLTNGGTRQRWEGVAGSEVLFFPSLSLFHFSVFTAVFPV